MKISLKKPSIIIAIITTIILILALVFIPKTSMFSSLIEQLKLKEGTEEEVSLDNWEISTVFYDSTVDEGKTPLTEITWDASDGGYGTGETRIITVQINYKNTNAVTTYQPGELEISIPNLVYNTNNNSNAQLESTIIVGANDSTHTGYDWTFVSNISYSGEPSIYHEHFLFKNEISIEEKTNFEGSIQIVYSITPKSETSIEQYESSCNHNHTKKIQATLYSKENINNNNTENSIQSNELSFTYHREYIHPWQKRTVTITKKANKLNSLDGLPSNANDYYWVKYTFTINGYRHADYPKEGLEYYVEDNIPENCLVIDKDYNILQLDDNEYTSAKFAKEYDSTAEEYIFVGYPKSIYNENADNLNITNRIDLYVKSGAEKEYSLENFSEVSLNLTDFEISYSGELYKIRKYQDDSNYTLFYQSLTERLPISYYSSRNGYSSRWLIDFSSKYTGEKYDLKIGDDILYVSSDNSYRKLNDNEYYFYQLSFPSLKDGNGLNVDGKYNVELWVRKAGNTEYTLYSEFLNSDKEFQFKENEGIVGFYYLIKDVNTDLNIALYPINAYMNYVKLSNIPTSGRIYNFTYTQAYIDGVLQNEPDLSSYKNYITKEEIATFDQNTYGTYMQRSGSFYQYRYYNVPALKTNAYAGKSFSKIIQNTEEETFTGTNALSIKSSGYSNLDTKDYIPFIKTEKFDPSEGISGFNLYDLLPEGMEITSSIEEIKNSLTCEFYTDRIYSIDKTIYSKEEYISLLKNNMNVTIINNWNNTNRTWISINIDLEKTPIYYFEVNIYEIDLFEIKYDFKISYDNFIEYGNIWENNVYAEILGSADVSYTTVDNGNKDVEENDINNNGDSSETLSFKKATTTITSVVSTHQDTTTYVKTDKSNHSTGVVEASYDSEYEYKLRARTGSSDVTNLILYTNIEEGHNGRGHWKGEFLGIDTTYAESKGYTIKTYYSENQNATNMKDDTSWKEYNDSIDKTKVKSLAFVFQDSEGKSAVLPANSLTYILIKMKAPSNENIKTLAYNNSWTEWNAIDSITKEPVDFITGINSNTVKISLPNSVQYEDIEINLEKIWNDNNNELGLRPNEITYKLISNSDTENATEIVLNINDISLTDSNIWSKTIEVPKYDDNGDVIEYTINEVIPTLENNYTYIKTINNYSITNQLAKNLTITKKWIDNNNSYLTRPSNVVIKVLHNNKEYKTVTITGDYTTNEWSNNIAVPVYDSEGNEYTYTLEELEVDNYSTTYDSTNLTFTNKLTGEEKITITKKWKDNSNSYNTRPLSINVILKQNNKNYKNITITGTTNTWTSEEITVPKYDDNGIKYNYTIEESLTLNNYGLNEYDQSNYTITNSLKNNIDITITKKWIDSDNEYNTRPKELKLTLLQNGKEYKTITLNGTTNTWTTNVEVPKYDDNQKEYQYTIKEIDDGTLPDYKDIIYSEDGLSVTNKLNKDIDLIITKNWIDYDNEYKARPDTIKINLLRNGELYKELELSGNTNTWTTIVKNMPVYDENSKKYIYTIEELPNDKINKYQKITYDQTTLTVTNELTEKPKVTLYFTVKNGYTTHDNEELKFDSEGLNEILKNHNINPDDEYLYEFELENTITKEVYKGNLSTQGILEFSDLPYGTYRALQKDDEYFDFVKMINLEDVPGVKFTEDEMGGIIEIEPTGKDIIYGVNIVNKITMPVKNVDTDTGSNVFIMIIIGIITATIMRYLFLAKKQLS